MRETGNDYPIDIVVPWVDGNDPEWMESRNYYANIENIPSVIDNGDARYRDWDILKYLFRGIEKYMPWIRTVHLITCGHLPQWINTNAKHLHIVKHTDYIPEEYLPTFSSHTIELNMHRINGLAEHFIYFNDDIIILRKMKKEDFFYKGLPRDYAIMSPLISGHRFSVQDTALTNIEIINDHFPKNKVIKSHFFKWFTPIYGKDVFQSLLMLPWPKYSNLYGKHLCNSFCRATFDEVWEKEKDVLSNTSAHKFRTRRDVNQWLIRDWQLVKGDFKPINPNRGAYYYLKNDNTKLLKVIKEKKASLVCINDNDAEKITDFNRCKAELTDALNAVLPNKSEYEK